MSLKLEGNCLEFEGKFVFFVPKKARLSRDGGGQLIRKSGKIMCSFSGAKNGSIYHGSAVEEVS